MSRLRTCAPLRNRIPQSRARAAQVSLRGDAGEGDHEPCPGQRLTWPRRTCSNSPADTCRDDNVAKTVPLTAPPRNRFSERLSRRLRVFSLFLVLHPPFGELGGLAAGVEADEPEVAVALRGVVVDGLGLDDGEVAVGGHEVPRELRVAWLVLDPDPAVDDLLAAAPRFSMRLGVVRGLLGEQPADVLGIVGLPCGAVAVDPLPDLLLARHGSSSSVPRALARRISSAGDDDLSSRRRPWRAASRED